MLIEFDHFYINTIEYKLKYLGLQILEIFSFETPNIILIKIC